MKNENIPEITKSKSIKEAKDTINEILMIDRFQNQILNLFNEELLFLNL